MSALVPYSSPSSSTGSELTIYYGFQSTQSTPETIYHKNSSSPFKKPVKYQNPNKNKPTSPPLAQDKIGELARKHLKNLNLPTYAHEEKNSPPTRWSNFTRILDHMYDVAGTLAQATGPYPLDDDFQTCRVGDSACQETLEKARIEGTFSQAPKPLEKETENTLGDTQDILKTMLQNQLWPTCTYRGTPCKVEHVKNLGGKTLVFGYNHETSRCAEYPAIASYILDLVKKGYKLVILEEQPASINSESPILASIRKISDSAHIQELLKSVSFHKIDVEDGEEIKKIREELAILLLHVSKYVGIPEEEYKRRISNLETAVTTQQEVVTAMLKKQKRIKEDEVFDEPMTFEDAVNFLSLARRYNELFSAAQSLGAHAPLLKKREENFREKMIAHKPTTNQEISVLVIGNGHVFDKYPKRVEKKYPEEHNNTLYFAQPTLIPTEEYRKRLNC